jgi:hypothetical protein
MHSPMVGGIALDAASNRVLQNQIDFVENMLASSDTTLRLKERTSDFPLLISRKSLQFTHTQS